MANQNAPFGARVVGTTSSNDYAGRVEYCTVLASDSTALFVNDLVTFSASGAAVGDDGQYHKIVTQAAAADIIAGVVVGFLNNSDYPNQIYRTGNTLRTAIVNVDPGVYIDIMASNGDGTATSVGNNSEIAVAAGSTITGYSGMTLDQAEITVSTAQLRITDIVNRVDNELGAYVIYRCFINEHYYKQTGGI